MKYRSEVDGLRALAVLPVILFHSGSPLFQGGFVGVDVFFVISGYLITSIIVSDLNKGSFSILDFYERRARRILPALVLVTVACIPFSILWMAPGQLKDFSESIVAVALFVSNVFFWSEGGYFSAAAELKPLLHTWSLAVEEQFYLLFPLFLTLVWRFGRNVTLLAIFSCAIVSLGLAEWASRSSPSANFYFAPTRAWELLAGTCCALVSPQLSLKAKNLISFAGLAAIFIAIFLYDESISTPSLFTALPVLGTAAVLLCADQGTLTQRVLSTKVAVKIGLISYSSYLWHHPLFAFARLKTATEPDLTAMYFLAGVSLLFGYITWRWIEQPFRRKSKPAISTRNGVFLCSLGSMIGIVLLAGSAYLARERYWQGLGPSSPVYLEMRLSVNHGLHPDCEGRYTESANCRTSENPQILLWGDSFAMHLAQGLVASSKTVGLQQHTMSVCSPIIGIAPVTADRPLSWSESCIDFNNKVLDWLSDKDVRLVVLSSPFEAILGESLLVSSGDLREGDNLDFVAEKIRETAYKIREKGAQVVIVSPPPTSGWDIGQCLFRQIHFGLEDSTCNFPQNYLQRPYELLERVQEDVPVYWLGNDICSGGNCKPFVENAMLYRDRSHLSKEGSDFLGSTNRWFTEFSRIAR